MLFVIIGNFGSLPLIRDYFGHGIWIAHLGYGELGGSLLLHQILCRFCIYKLVIMATNFLSLSEIKVFDMLRLKLVFGF